MVILKLIYPSKQTNFWAFLILFLSFAFNSLGQSKMFGNRELEVFAPTDFKTLTSRGATTQAPDGKMYFGGNGNILEYDGSEWRKIPFAANQEVTALACSPQGVIFVGGRNNFGFLAPNSKGKLQYNSLSNNNITFENDVFLRIVFKNENAFFQSQNQIIKLKLLSNVFDYFKTKKSNFKILSKNKPFFLIHEVNNTLFVQNEKGILFEIESENESQEVVSQEFINKPITTIIPLSNDSMLICNFYGDISVFSKKNGSRKWSSELSEFAENKIITHAAKINSEYFVLTTMNNGAVLFDKRGNIVELFSKENGFPSESVIYSFVNDNKFAKNTLWLTTTNGIVRCRIDIPIRMQNSQQGIDSEALSVITDSDWLYVLSVNNNLLRCPLDKSEMSIFERVKQVDNCLGIVELNSNNKHKVIAINHFGVYLSVKGKFRRILQKNNIQAIYKYSDNEFILQHNSKLELFTLNNSRVLQKSYIAKCQPFSGNLVRLGNDVFVPISQKEIVCFKYLREKRIWESDTLRNFPTLAWKRLLVINNNIIIQTVEGLFQLNRKKFNPFSHFRSFLKEKQTVADCVEDSAGNLLLKVWNSYSYELFFLRSTRNKNYEPAKNLMRIFPKMTTYETIQINNKSVFLVSGTEGLFTFNPETEFGTTKIPKPIISLFSTNKDTIFYGVSPIVFPETVRNAQKVSISYENNNVSFRFSTPYFFKEKSIVYRYKLVGLNSEWSDWQEYNVANFTNLPWGTLTFKLQAKNIFGKTSEVSIFRFTIKKPWYLSTAVLILAAFLLGALFYLAVHLRVRKVEREKLRLEKIVTERTSKIRSQNKMLETKNVEIEKQKEQLVDSNHLLKRMNEEIKRNQSKIVRQERLASVGKLASGLVDRVINPMNYITNYSQLNVELTDDFSEIIADEKDNLSEEFVSEFNEISGMIRSNSSKIELHGKSATRIIKSMENLLSTEKQEFKSFNINELLKHAINVAIENYKAQPNSVDIKLSHNDLAMELSVNRVEILRVFVFVIQNSLYAINEKQKIKEFKAEIETNLSLENNYCIITVKDNGIGISAKNIEKVCDPFFTTHPTSESNGLGLYLCKEILSNHKGEIIIKSQEDVNTEVIIKIPL